MVFPKESSWPNLRPLEGITDARQMQTSIPRDIHPFQPCSWNCHLQRKFRVEVKLKIRIGRSIFTRPNILLSYTIPLSDHHIRESEVGILLYNGSRVRFNSHFLANDNPMKFTLAEYNFLQYELSSVAPLGILFFLSRLILIILILQKKLVPPDPGKIIFKAGTQPVAAQELFIRIHRIWGLKNKGLNIGSFFNIPIMANQNTVNNAEKPHSFYEGANYLKANTRRYALCGEYICLAKEQALTRSAMNYGLLLRSQTFFPAESESLKEINLSDV